MGAYFWQLRFSQMNVSHFRKFAIHIDLNVGNKYIIRIFSKNNSGLK